MPRFLIYKERFTSISQEDIKPHYRAVPQEHLLTGVFNPRHDLRVEPDPVAQIDARTPQEALERFNEKQANAFM